MKRITKIFSLFLALAMLCTMQSMTALAATTDASDDAFWENVEEQRNELERYKAAAIAELNDNYTSKLGRYYNTSFRDEIKKLIDKGIDEISRVVLGVYSDGLGENFIYGNLQDYKGNIDVKLARIKSEIGERMALYDWADLVDYWTDAKKELDSYKNLKDYRAAQQKEVKDAIKAGKAAMDKAKEAAYVQGNPTSKDPIGAKKEVEKEFKAAKAKIDKIKTDAQLKKEEKSTPKAATPFKKGQHTYKVRKKGSTVAFTKTKSTAKSISVPATITYGGIKYKVTEVSGSAFKNSRKITKVKLGSNITKIGVSAFQGCKKLKTITISSKKLKTVGKKAFSGIYAKAKVKVPSGKKKAYKKLLKGKGLSKKAKIV